MKIIKHIYSKIRRSLLPTPHERVVNKWFKDRGDARLRIDYPLTADSLVMDVGGFRGDWAYAIHAKYQCKVHVFEPHPRAFATLKARFAKHVDIVLHDFGLSASDRWLPISDEGRASSVFHNEGSSLEIELKSIASWMKANNIRSVDLLKANIEGGEYELFEDMIANSLIPRFRYIQIQFHTVDDNSCARRKLIRSTLSKTHRLQWDYPMVWESWEKMN